MAPVFVLALGGGSGAGKTTLAGAIAARLPKLRVAQVSEDDFYHDNPAVDPATVNFDDPAARDYDLMADLLTRLRAGEGADLPCYSFVTHRRLDATRFVPAADLIILEGIHILGATRLRPLIDFAVYVDVPDDVRLARKLLRDIHERGRTTDFAIAQYLATVRPMHRLHTEPTRQYADLVISDESDRANGPAPAAIEQLIGPVLARMPRG